MRAELTEVIVNIGCWNNFNHGSNLMIDEMSSKLETAIWGLYFMPQWMLKFEMSWVQIQTMSHLLIVSYHGLQCKMSSVVPFNTLSITSTLPSLKMKMKNPALTDPTSNHRCFLSAIFHLLLPLLKMDAAFTYLNYWVKVQIISSHSFSSCTYGTPWPMNRLVIKNIHPLYNLQILYRVLQHSDMSWSSQWRLRLEWVKQFQMATRRVGHALCWTVSKTQRQSGCRGYCWQDQWGQRWQMRLGQQAVVHCSKQNTECLLETEKSLVDRPLLLSESWFFWWRRVPMHKVWVLWCHSKFQRPIWRVHLSLTSANVDTFPWWTRWRHSLGRGPVKLQGLKKINECNQPMIN